MKKLFVFSFVVFLFLGCTAKQEMTPKGMTEEKAAEEKSVKPPANSTKIVTEEVKKSVKPIVLAPKDSEQIISDGCWGLSVYDPETDTIEYYTSKGSFLGTKRK